MVLPITSLYVTLYYLGYGYFIYTIIQYYRCLYKCTGYIYYSRYLNLIQYD